RFQHLEPDRRLLKGFAAGGAGRAGNGDHGGLAMGLAELKTESVRLTGEALSGERRPQRFGYEEVGGERSAPPGEVRCPAVKLGREPGPAVFRTGFRGRTPPGAQTAAHAAFLTASRHQHQNK